MPYLNRDIPEIAQSINQQNDALVIMDASKNVVFFDVVQPQSLLHALNPDAQIQMQIVEKSIPDLSQSTEQSVFIYLPINASGMPGSPESLQAEMASRYNVSLEPIIPGTFWRVANEVAAN